MHIIRDKFNWKLPAHFAAIATFVVGMAVHMFGLLTIMHNYDDIPHQPIGHGTSVASGRWALAVIGKATQYIFGEYNMPWVNGVLFLLLIAVTVGFIVSLFEIKSRKIAAAVGIVFVTFPAATSTMFFTYTAVFYAFAILLSVLAVWLMRKYKYGFIPAVFCIAVSLGIYQAYVPITISLCVLLLIKQVLQEDVKFIQVLRRGIFDCVIIFAGLIIYILVQKVFTIIFDIPLTGYQGINEMGKLVPAEIPYILLKTFEDFCLMPVNHYAGLAQTLTLKISYLFLYVFTIALVVFIAVIKKKKLPQIILLVLLCLAFPIAVNFIAIMCPKATIYTLMVYSFAFVPCGPLILFETLIQTEGVQKKIKTILVVGATCCVILISIFNSYMANANYTSMYYSSRQVENYMSSMVTQVRMTEGFTPDKKWACVGVNQDPLIGGAWDYVPVYGGNVNARALVSAYSWRTWVKLYYGYAVPWATDEEGEMLRENPEVKEMNVWPSEGSVRVIGEYVVIKFEEVE